MIFVRIIIEMFTKIDLYDHSLLSDFYFFVHCRYWFNGPFTTTHHHCSRDAFYRIGSIHLPAHDPSIWHNHLCLYLRRWVHLERKGLVPNHHF